MAIAALMPEPLEGVGSSPPQAIVAEFDVLTQGVTSQAAFRSWLLQLSPVEFQVKKQTGPAEIVLGKTLNRTLVMRCHCDISALSASDQDKIAAGDRDVAKQAFVSVVPQELKDGLVDAWKMTVSDQKVSMLIRFKEPMVAKLLSVSGTGNMKLYVDSPAEWRHKFAPIWLKKDGQAFEDTD